MRQDKSLFLGEVGIILFEFGHVLEGILSGDAELGEVVVLSLDPNLPHLHVAQGFVGEGQVELVHFGGERPWLGSVGVARDAHHQAVEHDVEVFELGEVPLLHQALVSDVDGPRHQEQPEALPRLLLQKHHRNEAAHKASQQRNVPLPLLPHAPPQRAQQAAKDEHEAANEEAEVDRVPAAQNVEEVGGRLEDALDAEDGGEAALDEIAEQGDAGAIVQNGLNTPSPVLACLRLAARQVQQLQQLPQTRFLLLGNFGGREFLISRVVDEVSLLLQLHQFILTANNQPIYQQHS